MLQGIDVAEVARKAGVSQKTIYRLRSPKWTLNPSLKTLTALVEAIKGSKKQKQPAKAA